MDTFDMDVIQNPGDSADIIRNYFRMQPPFPTNIPQAFQVEMTVDGDDDFQDADEWVQEQVDGKKKLNYYLVNKSLLVQRLKRHTDLNNFIARR